MTLANTPKRFLYVVSHVSSSTTSMVVIRGSALMSGCLSVTRLTKKKMRLQKHLSGTPYSFPLLQNLGAPGGITFNGSIVASDNDTVIGWDYDHYWHRLRASEGQPVTEEEVIKDIKRFAVRFAKLCGINRK